MKNYRSFWDKKIDKLIKERREVNRLKRIHDKTRNYDSETGQRLSNVYKLRHLRVQEAIKKKENVAKFKSFQGRCINSTNKVKGFWELLKGKKCDKTPSQLLNPVNKSEMLTEK